MTQQEAFSLSLAFLEKEGVSYRRCYAQGLLTEAHIQIFCRGPGSILPGLAKNVWCFSFVTYEPKPDEVVCGGGVSVFVDADTGACGLWAHL
jgi:hypothetical protein